MYTYDSPQPVKLELELLSHILFVAITEDAHLANKRERGTQITISGGL